MPGGCADGTLDAGLLGLDAVDELLAGFPEGRGIAGRRILDIEIMAAAALCDQKPAVGGTLERTSPGNGHVALKTRWCSSLGQPTIVAMTAPELLVAAAGLPGDYLADDRRRKVRATARGQ